MGVFFSPRYPHGGEMRKEQTNEDTSDRSSSDVTTGPRVEMRMKRTMELDSDSGASSVP
jgi:hypothetical protein